LRGLPGGSSLARLLAQRRGYRNRKAPPSITVSDVLKWADRHKERTGVWPKAYSGPIADAPGETWHNIQNALQRGTRGFPRGLTIKQLLALHHGVRNTACLPTLRESTIVSWARAHLRRTGAWPTRLSGQISDAPGETWRNVDQALCKGFRGFPGGSSLARLLAERCGRPHPKELPPLHEGQILVWADAHFRRTGRWPTQDSGPVLGVEHLTWRAVHSALVAGLRHLPGKDSLAKLLVRNRRKPPYRGGVT
jgi:hypothetical protein